MANEISRNIGSFSLDQSHLTISDINIRVSKSLGSHPLPKYHGSVIPIGKRSAIRIKLSGTCIGTEYDDLRTNLDALKAAFENSSEQNFTIDDDRVIKAQYEGFSYSFANLRTFAEFEVNLIVSDPFWYAASLTTDTRTPTSGVGYTINNPGNAPARVKISGSRAAGSIVDLFKVTNSTTGEIAQFRGTVATADILVIDNRVSSGDLSVTNDGVDAIDEFEGSFITLNPGDNTIVFTGAAGVSLTLEFYPAYY